MILTTLTTLSIFGVYGAAVFARWLLESFGVDLGRCGSRYHFNTAWNDGCDAWDAAQDWQAYAYYLEGRLEAETPYPPDLTKIVRPF